MKKLRQAEHPEIRLIEGNNGEITLYIADGQAMQGWERDLMWESADILCQYGSEFLEVGLGLGISALRIAKNPKTRRHVIVEKYQSVIDIFYDRHPSLPPTLEIIHADFFDYVYKLEASILDGIFFDPALPMSMWDDQAFWDRVMPLIVRPLRLGGVFIPFFSTQPVLRKQYVRFFDRVIVERRSFTAYSTTEYTHGTSGDAFIQCFVKTREYDRG